MYTLGQGRTSCICRPCSLGDPVNLEIQFVWNKYLRHLPTVLNYNCIWILILLVNISFSDPFFRTEEKYQYPPDITPLILAAHRNDHELIQLFISRGCTIEKPHAIDCQCDDCLMKQQVDSLRRSRSRLNRSVLFDCMSYIGAWI